MTNPYKSPKMTKASLIAPNARATIFERLMSHSKLNGECLEYVGNNDHNGYGRIKANGRQLGAHRVAYVEFIGDIDAGMVVMHSCDNPACINPNHLSLGTVKQNVHDCINKGRFYYGGRALNAANSHGSNYVRPICVYNEVESRIYRSPSDAIKDGFNKSTIYDVLNGKFKTTNGYKAYYLPQAIA